MLQDIKTLVMQYTADLTALDLTAMRYKASGDRLAQVYTFGRFDMLKSVRRTLKVLIIKNEGYDEPA